MNNPVKKLLAVLLIIPIFAAVLSGCWDSKEVVSRFIISGVGVDKAKDSENVDVTFVIGKPVSPTTGSKEPSGSGSPSLIITGSGDTPFKAAERLNFVSSRSLFFQHNQLIIFSSDFVKDGITDKIDLFFRTRDSRMEVPVFVSLGSAKKVLSAKTNQEQDPTLYLSRIMLDLKDVSVNYEVRVIDLLIRMLEKSSAAVIPLVSLEKDDQKDTLEISGMAILKDGKMIDSINNEETRGYVLAMGDVSLMSIEAEKSNEGKVIFNISTSHSKRKVELRDDGGVKVTFDVTSNLVISELTGFKGYSTAEITPILEEMTKKEIEKKITDTFNKTKELKADIFRIGTDLYRGHPKKWEKMKNNWDEYYSDIELDVKVEVKIREMGQVIRSLEMMEGQDENR